MTTFCRVAQSSPGTGRRRHMHERSSEGQGRGKNDTTEGPMPNESPLEGPRPTEETVIWSDEQLNRIWKHTTG